MRARWIGLSIAAIGVFPVALLVRRVVRHVRRAREPVRPPPADVFPPAEIADEEVTIERSRDGGDLYGVHTIAAQDREHPDEDQAEEVGETWIDALAEDAIAGGPEPEATLDFTDVDDIEFPNADTKDRPIADKGSGGRRGL